MSKGTTLILLGALVMLAPFSGLPGTWLEVAEPLIGLAIVLMGYRCRRDERARGVPVAAPGESGRN